MSDTEKPSLDQMRAWLILEGYSAYLKTGKSRAFTFSKDGDGGYFWSYHHNIMRAFHVLDAEVPHGMDQVPDVEIEGMYAMAAEGAAYD